MFYKEIKTSQAYAVTRKFNTYRRFSTIISAKGKKFIMRPGTVSLIQLVKGILYRPVIHIRLVLGLNGWHTHLVFHLGAQNDMLGQQNQASCVALPLIEIQTRIEHDLQELPSPTTGMQSKGFTFKYT